MSSSPARPERPTTSARVPVAVVAGLFIASLALRPQILAIGPLVPLIRDDLDLPAALAGLLTTIPVLCMGIFAPFGPRLAARVGPRAGFAICLGLIAGFGLARAVSPGYPAILVTTFGIGIGIGMAGAIPSMVVKDRIATRPALGTGAYAAGITAGSALAAGVAVPLAIDGAWRLSLALISVGVVFSIVAWLALDRSDAGRVPVRTVAPRLPIRSGTAWLLAVVFALQSILFYGIVAWLPNAFVERGWSVAEGGALIAVFNAVGLVSAIGVPLIADRLGQRRPQLVTAAVAATLSLIGIVVGPDLVWIWIVVLGLAIGAIFPLVLTLPLDVADDPAQVGAVAALMLLGGYILSASGPIILGTARDATGDFTTSLWLLVVFSVALLTMCLTLSPARLHRGVPAARVTSSP
jgi:CP family cyanate transporter-like MFS transporter